MNGTERKCFTVSAALHGVLLAILAVASAFYVPEPPKPPEALSFIPLQLAAQPSAPGGAPAEAQPQRPVTPAPAPAEPPPRQIPRPAPRPEARPEPVPQVKPQDKPPDKPQVKPQDKPVPTKPEPARPKPSFKLAEDTNREKERQVETARAEEKRRQEALRDLADLRNRLSNSFSASTTIELPGPGGGALASYGQEVVRIYEEAWQPPSEVSDPDSIVKMRVTVGRQGVVRADPILKRSGDRGLDRSVEEALARVRRRGLPPFPPGTKEDEQSFVINFNLKSRRQF